MALEVAGAALVFTGAAAVAFLHLRHLALVALVVLAPLPGLAAVQAFAGMTDGLAAPSLVWLVALSVNLMLADEAVLRIVGGEPAHAAVNAAFAARGRPLAAATLSACIATGLAGEWHWQGSSALTLLVAVGTGAALMRIADRFTYGEDVIARSNRSRERWQRLCDRLIAVARPRWGFTVSGIGLVFAVLGIFEMQPLSLAPDLAARMPWAAVAAGVVLTLAAALAIRDWRACLSALGALALATTIGLWGLTRLGLPLTLMVARPFVLTVGQGAVLLLIVGAESGGFGRTGDDATIASARMLVRMGPGLLAAGLASVVGLLLSALAWDGQSLALAAMAGFSGAGAVLFQPALAIVIETWFPRAATVAGRYRLH